MKSFFLLLILCSSAAGLRAQNNFYHFSQAYAPYQALSGDTIATPSDWKNGIEYTNRMAGTTYSFFGKKFHFDDLNIRLSYTSDGNLIVQDDTSQFVISVLETAYDSVDAQTAISFRQTRSGGEDLLALQWQNISIHGGPPGNFVNFQIFFNLTSGAAELHYGPSSANNASGYPNVIGPRVGISYFNKTTAKNYERIVLSGQPSAIPSDTTKTTIIVDSATTAVAYTLTGVPPAGTIYRFTPHQQSAAIKPVLPGISNVIVTPNPFESEFTIQSDFSQRYVVTDVRGKQVFSGKASLTRQKIITSQWPVGIYILRLQNGTVKKLFKK